MIIITDFLLPFISLSRDKDYKEEELKKEGSTTDLIISVLGSILTSIVFSAYTFSQIYSGIRKRYITRDFLYDKQINNNLSLVKTFQMICIIPDYRIISALSIYMIVKMIVIIVSVIITLKFYKFFVFKNDLGEYNLTKDGWKYDSDFELNKILKEKRKLIIF